MHYLWIKFAIILFMGFKSWKIGELDGGWLGKWLSCCEPIWLALKIGSLVNNPNLIFNHRKRVEH